MKLRVLKKLQSKKCLHECWARAYPYFHRVPTLPIPLDAYATITAPENAHLFTAQAAHNAFVHLRAVPALTPQQIELHGEIAKSGDAFSLENAVKLYNKGMGAA